MMAFRHCLLAKSHRHTYFAFCFSTLEIMNNYRAFLLKLPAHKKIYWNKRKCVYEKAFNSYADWFWTQTSRPFHCFWNTNMAGVTSCENTPQDTCCFNFQQSHTKPKSVLTCLICVLFCWALVLCFCFEVLLHTCLCYLLWLRPWLFTEVIKRSLRWGLKIHYGGLLLWLLQPWGTRLTTPFPPQTSNRVRCRCTAAGCSVSTCF